MIGDFVRWDWALVSLVAVMMVMSQVKGWAVTSHDHFPWREMRYP